MPLYTFCEAKLHFFRHFSTSYNSFSSELQRFPQKPNSCQQTLLPPEKDHIGYQLRRFERENLQEKPKNFDEIGENTLSRPLQHTHPVTLKGQPRSDRFFN